MNMIEIVIDDIVIIDNPRWKYSRVEKHPPRELKLFVTYLSQVLKHRHFIHLGGILGQSTKDTTCWASKIPTFPFHNTIINNLHSHIFTIIYIHYPAIYQ